MPIDVLREVLYPPEIIPITASATVNGVDYILNLDSLAFYRMGAILEWLGFEGNAQLEIVSDDRDRLIITPGNAPGLDTPLRLFMPATAKLIASVTGSNASYSLYATLRLTSDYWAALAKKGLDQFNRKLVLSEPWNYAGKIIPVIWSGSQGTVLDFIVQPGKVAELIGIGVLQKPSAAGNNTILIGRDGIWGQIQVDPYIWPRYTPCKCQVLIKAYQRLRVETVGSDTIKLIITVRERDMTPEEKSTIGIKG